MIAWLAASRSTVELLPILVAVFIAHVANDLIRHIRCPPSQLMDAYCSKKNLPTTGYVFMVDE